MDEIDLIKIDDDWVSIDSENSEREKYRLILRLFGWFVLFFSSLLVLCWGLSMLGFYIFSPHLLNYKSVLTLLVVESLPLSFAALFSLGLFSHFKNAIPLSRQNVFWFLHG